MSKQALYRFFDGTGELLYVGITMNPSARWPKHRGDKPWWQEVESITLEMFESRKEVLAAETEAIKTEHPRYNIAHNNVVRMPVDEPRLVWTCLYCETVIEVGSGYFWISEDEYNHYQEEEERLSAIRGTPEARNLAWYEQFPTACQWTATHRSCMDGDDALWSIDIEQMSTATGVLRATANLVGKHWLAVTDWFVVLEDAANGGR